MLPLKEVGMLTRTGSIRPPSLVLGVFYYSLEGDDYLVVEISWSRLSRMSSKFAYV